MKRFNVNANCLTPELCKDIHEALQNEDVVLLSIEDLNSDYIKITDRSIILTDVFGDRPRSERKYQETKYEEIIGIDEDDERKIEVKLELKCNFEIVNIDSDYTGDISIVIKLTNNISHFGGPCRL